MEKFLFTFRMMYKLILPGLFFAVFGVVSLFIDGLRPWWWRFLLCGVGLTACGIYLAHGAATADDDDEQQKPDTPATKRSGGS